MGKHHTMKILLNLETNPCALMEPLAKHATDLLPEYMFLKVLVVDYVNLYVVDAMHEHHVAIWEHPPFIRELASL
jgi:hypothetical protein